MSESGSNKRVANGLIALSSAAVVAVYGAGYERTRAAAERFSVQAAERRPRAALPLAAGETAAMAPLAAGAAGDVGDSRCRLHPAHPPPERRRQPETDLRQPPARTPGTSPQIWPRGAPRGAPPEAPRSPPQRRRQRRRTPARRVRPGRRRGPRHHHQRRRSRPLHRLRRPPVGPRPRRLPRRRLPRRRHPRRLRPQPLRPPRRRRLPRPHRRRHQRRRATRTAPSTAGGRHATATSRRKW